MEKKERYLDLVLASAMADKDTTGLINMAHMLCSVYMGLPELTEKAWARLVFHGPMIYTVLGRAMVELIQQGRAEESFFLSQRWKAPPYARPFIQHLRGKNRDAAGPASGAMEAFDGLCRAVADLGTAGSMDEAMDCLDRVNLFGNRYESALNQVLAADPVLGYRLGMPAESMDIVDALPERGGAVGLVDFTITDEGMLILILDRRGAKVQITPLVASEFSMDNVMNLVGVFRKFVVERPEDQGPSRQEALGYISKTLHDRLWCNLAKKIGRLGISQLILVPDVWTRQLPHHLALVCGNEIKVPEDVPVVQRERMADLFPMEIVPSVQALALSQWLLRPRKLKKFLMVADPTEDLPGARHTARWLDGRLAETVPVTSLIGTAATRDRVLSEAAVSDAVVFCCHGVFDAQDPEQSFLKFADAPWTLSQMLDTHGVSPGAIYVLSACEVGTMIAGEHDQGGAIPGALLSAGAASVLAPLWEMEDISFGYLTEQFLKYLGHPGYRPSAALFRAMNDVKKWPRKAVCKRVSQFLVQMEESGEAARRPDAYLSLSNFLAWAEDEAPDPPFEDVSYWGGAVVFGSGWAAMAGATSGLDFTAVEQMITGWQVPKFLEAGMIQEAWKEVEAALETAHGPERIDPLMFWGEILHKLNYPREKVLFMLHRARLLARAHGRMETAQNIERRIARITWSF